MYIRDTSREELPKALARFPLSGNKLRPLYVRERVRERERELRKFIPAFVCPHARAPVLFEIVFPFLRCLSIGEEYCRVRFVCGWDKKGTGEEKYYYF